MINRLETFSIFCSHVFQLLYDAFPVPVYIKIEPVIETMLNFQEQDEKKRKLETHSSWVYLHTLNIESGNPSLTDEYRDDIISKINDSNVKKRVGALQADIEQFEKEAKEIKEIYWGTISFLEFEGYIRKCEHSQYQLAEKGFAHLNKRFKDSDFGDPNETLISRLKEQLTNPSKMGAQLIVSLVSSSLSNMAG